MKNESPSYFFLIIAFLSGGSLLATETLSLKLIDFTVGAFPLSYQTVVASFILGAGFGGVIGTRISRFYKVEVFLAIIHFIFAFASPLILSGSGLIFKYVFSLADVNLVSTILGICYLFPLGTALGVLFPYLIEKSANIKLSYGLYGVGGAAFFIVFEFYLYPKLGLPVSFILLGVLHLFIAYLIFFERPDPKRTELSFSFSFELFSIGVFTGGVQTLWLVVSQLFFRPYYYVPSSTAFLFIMGIGLGSLLFQYLKWPLKRVLVQLLYGVLISGVLLWIYSAVIHRPPSSPAMSLLILGVILLPTTIFVGMIFPSFFNKNAVPQDKAAYEFLGLSLGNISGLMFFSFSYYLLPFPFYTLGAMTVLFCCFIVSRGYLRKRLECTVCFLFSFSLFFICPTDVIQRSKDFEMQNLSISQIYGGVNEVSMILKENGVTSRLYQNGYAGGAFESKNLMFESLVAAKGMSFATELSRALILGAGYGRTAGFASLFFDETHVMDIGNTVPRLLKTLKEINYGLLDNPRVSFKNLDGSLAPYIFKKENFNLIVNTVHPPYYISATKLYTKEYMERIKYLLKPDGIYVTWMSNRLSSYVLQVMKNTADSVFNSCKLFNNWDQAGHETFEYVLQICSRGDLSFRMSRHENLYKSSLPAARHLRRYGADPLKIQSFTETDHVHSLFYPAPEILRSGY